MAGGAEHNSDPYQSESAASSPGRAQPLPTPEEIAAEDAKVAACQTRVRRAGVAAESVTDEAMADYKKPVYQKDDETNAKIKGTLKSNEKMQVLFGHLDGEPLQDVINAFYTKEVAGGTDIITQGDAGDCLYIVASGNVDIFVARPGPDGKIAAGDKGTKVVSFGPGALFGELALMYNAPRAATVMANGNVVVWALSAVDFKMLLAKSSQANYAKYEGWLSEIDLLKVLNHFELAKLADCMSSELFDDDEVIIQQGDEGDRFFVVEDGCCDAYIHGENGEMKVKTYSERGSYFGEIALLTNAPRKATVKAGKGGCSCVSVSKEDFTLILGPLSEKLKGQVDLYPQYADFLKA